MKRMSFSLSLFLLVNINSIAQSNDTPVKKRIEKAFLILSAGPSLPVGIFSSTDFNKSGAGYANLGYNVNLNAGYQITKHFGIASTIFYSRFNVNDKFNNDLRSLTAITSFDFTPDHWQYGGIVAGPMFTLNVIEKIMIDFKIMAGFAKVNSPSLKMISNATGQVIATSEDKWTDAMAIQSGSNMRYNFAPRFCAFANIDYGFMHPKWTSYFEEDFKQEIGVINFNIGIGTTF